MTNQQKRNYSSLTYDEYWDEITRFGEEGEGMDFKEFQKIQAEEILETAMEYGDIPKYSWEWNGKQFVICKNDGQFHRGECQEFPGWATYIGHFKSSYIVKNYQEFLKVSEAEKLGLSKAETGS